MTNEQINKKLEEFLVLVEKNYSKSDAELARLAFDFADEAHKGQKRYSGDPYIIHPLATARKLAEMKMDITTVIGGLLHDVPEDTSRTLADIEKEFGSETAHLVSGIVKIGVIKYRGMERYAENLRKMFVAMSQDIRTIFIKFADRLHNLQTLQFRPPHKQKRIATEVLEIYSPIADRLSMGMIKGELEDLAFKYVYPKEYEWLNKILPLKYKAKEKFLKKIQLIVLERLKKENIAVSEMAVFSRAKYLYSLYKKLQRPEIDNNLDKIFDLFALRVIVPTVADCYSVLGIIHNLFQPMPKRIKDYIAQPKPNGYQSLQTTVFDDKGEIIEFQIRTKEMDEKAEYGIAAHWNYKETGGKINPEQLKWINELVKWQEQTNNNEEFINSIKFDIFQNRIFAMTPHGDAIDLPEGATPIDFAYHVHSNLGNKCVGAMVNDQLVSLDHPLESGDVVEIVTNKNRKLPNHDWLEMVKTTMAKNKIRAALNKEKTSERKKLEGKK